MSFLFTFTAEHLSEIECSRAQASQPNSQPEVFLSLLNVSVSHHRSVLPVCLSALSGRETSTVGQMLNVLLCCSLDTASSSLCLFHVYKATVRRAGGFCKPSASWHGTAYDVTIVFCSAKERERVDTVFYLPDSFTVDDLVIYFIFALHLAGSLATETCVITPVSNLRICVVVLSQVHSWNPQSVNPAASHNSSTKQNPFWVSSLYFSQPIIS